MGLFGFTEGIVLGVLLACIFFVVIYSRNSIIRGTYSGEELRSPVHRLLKQQLHLDLHSKCIHVVVLQGFIFFGTLYQLDQYIHHIIATVPRLSYVIIDFEAIDGIDFSTTGALIRIKKLTKENEIMLLFCGMRDDTFLTMEKCGVVDDLVDRNVTVITTSQDNNLILFDQLNDALEWCENKILEKNYATDPQIAQSLLQPSMINIFLDKSMSDDCNHGIVYESLLGVATATGLIDAGIVDEDFIAMSKLFTATEFEDDAVLWDIGEAPECIYLIESGELHILIRENSEFILFESLLRGTMTGEVEMFAMRKYTSRLITKGPCCLWRLSRDEINMLSETDPKLMLKLVRLSMAFDRTQTRSTRFKNWSMAE